MEEFDRDYPNVKIKARKYTELKKYTYDDLHFKNVLGHTVPTSICDAAKDYDAIIYIRSIETAGCSRGMGYGTTALQLFIREFSGFPIILEAGFLYENDYIRYLSDPKFGEWYLENLELFYARNGFLNANNRYGCYKDMITMIKEAS
jgi:hypothetical protein